MKDKIFLYGSPGSGKTTLGKVLSAALGVQFVDLDEHIE
jgi:shikimate kinase